MGRADLERSRDEELPRTLQKGRDFLRCVLEDILLGSLRLNPPFLKRLWLCKRELKYHSEAALRDTQGEAVDLPGLD